MDREIREVVGRYGYMQVHRTFQDIMKQDYEYLKSVFEPVPTDSVHMITIDNKANETSGKRGRKSKAEKPHTDLPRHSPVVGGEVKNVTIQAEGEGDLLSITSFIPQLVEKDDIGQPAPVSAFRDPKEQKAWQKEEEMKKRTENESVGLSVSDILTKENLKQWVEEEGKTYAWVAREKAGCPEAQVAATAQMMGIRSKISRRRGLLMARHG